MITTYTFLDNLFLENLIQYQHVLNYIALNKDILLLSMSLITLSGLTVIVLAGKNLGDKIFKGIVGTNAAYSLYDRMSGGNSSNNNNDKKDDKKDDKKNEPTKSNNSK